VAETAHPVFEPAEARKMRGIRERLGNAGSYRTEIVMSTGFEQALPASVENIRSV